MGRIFFITNRACRGAVGGGRGVIYKLYLANQKYHLIKDAYYVFTDIDFSDNDMIDVASVPTAEAITENFASVRKLINKIGVLSYFKKITKDKKASKWISALDRKYHFAAEDVFIFHDVESAYLFAKKFKMGNTVTVFHQQGSLYSEWRSMGGKDSELFHSFLNRQFSDMCTKVKYLAFPSDGARESFTDSEPKLEEVVESKEKITLYNGFTLEKREFLASSEAVCEAIEKLKNFTGYKFATISTLNYAKGVEQIPDYLRRLKEKGYSFRWVMIGDGNRAEALKNELRKNEIEEDVIWIKDPVPHDDILALFTETDFYILFHRFSIFDFATIEAMALGNIPILSDIGGNKEVVINGETGLLLQNFTDTDSFENLVSNTELSSLKKRNIELQSSKFSEEAFLKGYADLIHDHLYL